MAFVRRESRFRAALGSVEFPFETDRYVLYLATACPWATRTLAVAKLKGLSDRDLAVVRVHPTWQATKPGVDEHCGWVFRKPNEPVLPLALQKLQGDPFSPGGSAAQKVGIKGSALDEVAAAEVKTSSNPSVTPEGAIVTPHCDEDAHSGWNCRTLRELYEHCGESLEAGGKFTTPLIFDRKTKQIVNNESSEIIVQLNEWPAESTSRGGGAGQPEVDLNPERLRKEMKELDDYIYANINDGVYRCGFARSQEAYDTAIANLVKAMQFLEERFKERSANSPAGANPAKYLFGDELTMSDVRLFQTLVRMDECYAIYFKCYAASLLFYPEVLKYTARVLAIPEVAESTYLQDCKLHYFTSHPHLNTFAVVPKETEARKRLEAMAKMAAETTQ